ncbi:hypothetical protein BpHYR1_032668 [Brachionus plicatilis]|uniref:Uncharacterized protein n=1 Tax=Brachionus plicatilis TaxID=10195 RepID=A0A3M7PST0_BRAPC|nr:hypothetical protein BpHYR1_032668 [Brachionus plicatilis]
MSKKIKFENSLRIRACPNLMKYLLFKKNIENWKIISQMLSQKKSAKSKQSDNIYLNDLSNCSSNILLTPVQNSSVNQTNLANKAQSSLCQNPVQKSQAKANLLAKKSCASTNCPTSKKQLDFTDAKLVVERNTQGKHVVGKIIINQTNEPSNSSTLNKSLSNTSLNSCCLTNLKVLNDPATIDMNGHAANSTAPSAHNQLLDKNNSFNVYHVNGCRTMAKSSIPTSNSLNSINHGVCQNRMRIFFNQMAPKSPKNAHSNHTNLVCEHQSTIVKLTSNDLSSNPTTTGYNSLNDDSSSDFLEQTPIYTDNRTKSRIVKRYDKKRANTEVIIDLEQMNQPVQRSNVHPSPSVHKAIVKITSSPKPPPRIKKKYRKSKTADVAAQFDTNSAFGETSLNQQEDSLEESDYESGEGVQSSKRPEKLTDSLESINLTLHNDIKIEDDSLLFNNDHGISLSLSTTSSISNINEIELDNEQDILHSSQRNGRAQWDKTAQKLEFKTQLTSPNGALFGQHCHHSSPTADQTHKKESNNLNSVKEQLYQMKKTIDAKINLKKLESNKTLWPPVRTTPRKVKKRSGERSVTAGIFKEADRDKKTPPDQSSGAVMAKLSAKVSQATICKQTSSSLHNLNHCLKTDSASRTRRDSSASSSHTNLSFCSPNTTPREFKENKAYELRKKSTLLNKIVTKNHQHDPIYSRSHPISAQMTQQQALNVTLNEHSVTMPSVVADAATSARKRLFAKKSEKQFDPNLSIGSNGSSSFSSNSIPVATNFILRNKILASSPIVNKPKVATNANKKKLSPIKPKPPPRSRSNNDLFYQLERTNSAQDLIELINNCEPPVGNLTKYRVLLSECENCDPKAKGSKRSNVRKPVKLSVNKQKAPRQKLNCSNDQNEKANSDSSSMSISQHKRSRSLPSCECVPLSQQQDFDAAFDEEYHEETYWQDVKTNF